MRWTTAATLRKDAETFARLHAARWAGRGWSRLAELGHSLPDWLEDVGRGMIDKGRFGMCVHEVDGSPVCVDFHLLAGEELAAVNMGWDERYAKLAPARLAGLRLVERAAAWGCRRLRLGRGEHESKLCLANGNDPVACSIFMPPSARLPNAYAHALPALAREHARDFARRALPPRWFDATRSVRHRAAPGTRLQGPSLRRLRS